MGIISRAISKENQVRFENEKRNALLFLGSFAGALLLSLGAAGAANAVSASEDAQSSATTQAEYEQEISDFVAENPEPIAVGFDATVGDQNAYQETMAAWWGSIPWEAVAGQWGCELGTEKVTVSEPNEEGLVTAGHGGMMHCGILSDAELSIVAQPTARSTSETQRGVLATYCDFPGGTEDYCLSSSGTTMTASFQWQGAGNKTGQARLGLVGLGNACGLGTQIALGGVGLGTQGSVWYASGTVNQNSKYSSSFLIGTANYGSWCATL